MPKPAASAKWKVKLWARQGAGDHLLPLLSDEPEEAKLGSYLLMGSFCGLWAGAIAFDARDGDVLDAEWVARQAVHSPVHGILEVGEHGEWLMGVLGNNGEAAWNHSDLAYCTPHARNAPEGFQVVSPADPPPISISAISS